jgi:PAS domain S-box-containing protein
MNKKDMIQEKFDELRREAEALMMEKGFESQSVVDSDPLELIQELQTYQVELELQNEELQRSQQELMEFKTRYTELYDFTPVGYVCLDKKGVIRNANLTLADMLSLERSALIDQPLTRHVFFEDQDICYRHLKDLAESKQRQICELRMKKSDGILVDVQLESTVFPYQSWRPEQFRTVIIDITERKQMEKEQDALRDRLYQSHKMESIRTIAGGIAHDFNNILFIIIGNIDMAVEETKDWHPVYTKLERIRAAAERAAGIVKLLLSFSRTSDEKQTPVDLIDVIRDSLVLLRASIPTFIDIHTKFPDQPVMILSDKIQIGQILMNLCTNAAQAMEETGGLLEIRVEPKVLPEGTAEDCPPGKYAEMTVKDNGPGIDPGILSRIFDPYFTTRAVGKGSGLGLAVVDTIVKNHKGTITVQNRPEGGTLFTMRFPMVEQKPGTKIKSMKDSFHGTERILFVDDEVNIAEMALEALKLFDYRVEAMSDPEDALALFKLNPGLYDETGLHVEDCRNHTKTDGSKK